MMGWVLAQFSTMTRLVFTGSYFVEEITPEKGSIGADAGDYPAIQPFTSYKLSGA
jgi:hypothetical protein